MGELVFLIIGLTTGLSEPIKAASMLKDALKVLGVAESAMPAICATAEVIETVKPVAKVAGKATSLFSGTITSIF